MYVIALFDFIGSDDASFSLSCTRKVGQSISQRDLRLKVLLQPGTGCGFGSDRATAFIQQTSMTLTFERMRMRKEMTDLQICSPPVQLDGGSTESSNKKYSILFISAEQPIACNRHRK